MRGRAADHDTAGTSHDHRPELAVHRRTDQKADSQPSPLLRLQQVARAEQLVLMPVTGQERRRLSQYRIEMLFADHRHHATAAQPQPHQRQRKRRGGCIQRATHRTHAAGRSRDLAVDGVAQRAAAVVILTAGVVIAHVS
jgi:ABC-type nickel/cobalt efflux system permease component RcnA